MKQKTLLEQIIDERYDEILDESLASSAKTAAEIFLKLLKNKNVTKQLPKLSDRQKEFMYGVKKVKQAKPKEYSPRNVDRETGGFAWVLNGN